MTYKDKMIEWNKAFRTRLEQLRKVSVARLTVADLEQIQGWLGWTGEVLQFHEDKDPRPPETPWRGDRILMEMDRILEKTYLN